MRSGACCSNRPEETAAKAPLREFRESRRTPRQARMVLRAILGGPVRCADVPATRCARAARSPSSEPAACVASAIARSSSSLAAAPRSRRSRSGRLRPRLPARRPPIVAGCSCGRQPGGRPTQLRSPRWRRPRPALPRQTHSASSHRLHRRTAFGHARAELARVSASASSKRRISSSRRRGWSESDFRSVTATRPRATASSITSSALAPSTRSATSTSVIDATASSISAVLRLLRRGGEQLAREELVERVGEEPARA